MAPYQNYTTERFENLKQIYRASAKRFGEKTLFMQKRGKTYRNISFRQYSADVDALGTELYARGFSGKKIIIMGENGYEWVTAYMAVICGVGTAVPVDKEISAEELANLIKLSDAEAMLCSASLKEKLTRIGNSMETVFFEDFPKLIEAGNVRIQACDRTFLDAEIDVDAMSALIFTSGTTDAAKGVMLSHRNLCFNLSEMCRMVYIDESDIFLSVLPLHHVYQCTCGFLCPLYRGSTVAFGDGLRYITRNMQEVHPTVMLCVPLLIETMYHKIEANIQRQGMEKKIQNAVNLTNALLNPRMRAMAKQHLFADIHKSFGGKLRLLISGGASANPAVLKGFRDLGISAIQGYGLTECSPIAALNRDTFYNDGSAGMATPDTLLDIYDMKDDGTGEIRFKGDNIMLGYYKMPALTAEVIRDGWFYTGDLGYLDENGFLFITGRKKNVIITAGGKNIFPEELETYLNRTRFIKESVVVGYVNPKKKDYDIVAIIHPDYAKLEQTFGPSFTEERLDLELRKAVSEVNGIVLPYKRMKTFLISKKEFPKNTSHKIKRLGIADAFAEEYYKK
ncbi:MAG: AMP-binding protein [Clostridia bacterium]|nr:AMP-binding protein [Clostridia bacterium]